MATVWLGSYRKIICYHPLVSAIFRINEIQQDTQAWHDWRRKGIGATEAGKVRTGRKGAQTLLRVKTGKEEERDFQSAAMVRGKVLEAEARAAYEKEVGITVKPACVENINYPWLRASLDGISNDEKVIVEIKCGKRIYNSVKSNGKVPPEYVAQTQHILAATGLESLDFWCYEPGLSGIRIQVIRNKEYIAELFKKEQSFWAKVLDGLDVPSSAPESSLEDFAEPIEENLNKSNSMTSVDQGKRAALGKFRSSENPYTSHRFSMLRMLDLSDHQMTGLPPRIGKLDYLTRLYLKDNQLTALSPEIGNLTDLVFLYIGNNQLTALPPEIGNLTYLVALQLYNNRLTALPPEIGNLTDLDFLDLSNNQLTALPPEIGNLTTLLHLDLSNNRLTALPPEIGNLKKLRTLNLNNNRLTALPSEIGSLELLRSLWVRNNRLTGLPDTIGQLTSIRQFGEGAKSRNVSKKNQVANLSEGGLDLSNNLLTVLPPEISDLSHRHRFHRRKGFTTDEICREKDSDESLHEIIKKDGLPSRYKLDISGNPLR
jgi:putative phage-type endonuclease